MSAVDEGDLSWIRDNRLVLIALGILGGFPIISLYTTFLTILEATLLGIVVDGILISVFHRERRRWTDKYRYRASFLLVGGFLVFIGVLTSLLALSISIIVASLIGALIPGIYYAYNEIVKRPSIEIGGLNLEEANVAPMYYTQHIARPAIFLNIEIMNSGRATAENCTIKFWFKQGGQEESSYARWAIPEADERYNLLPDESLSIHILKIFLTKDFFLLADQREAMRDIPRALDNDTDFADLIYRKVVPQGNPSGRIRIDEGLEGDELQCADIIDQICYYYPTRKPPEQEESVRGGWVGNEIESGEYILKIQPLAENYKKPRETISIENSENNILILKVDEIAGQVADGIVPWQEQWSDKGYTDFKERVLECCVEITR